MSTLATNWKTTLAGVLGIFMILSNQFGWLTMEQAGSIAAVATSFGLILSKDHNK